MNRKEQFSTVFFFVMLLVVHHYFFYPPVVEERRANDTLYDLGALVASGDRMKIQDGIMRYLSDDVRIRLDTTYTGMQMENGEQDKPAVSYEFSKPLFRAYLSNMFSSLTAFAFQGYVQNFNISADWKSAKAVIAANGGAQGKARFMTRQMDVRFSFNAFCEIDLSLAGSRPVARSLNCKLFLPPSSPIN